MKIKYLLILIIVLGLLFRFVSLDQIPAGITSDEANKGYDSYALSVNGKDQWGSFLPSVAFRGFGDYRLPVYNYLILPFITFFDVSSLSVRLPSAIAGAFSVLIIYFLSKKLFNRSVGLLSAFLLAVSPWAIGLSRQGLEANVAMTLYLLAFLLFLNFDKSKKYLYLSCILFGMTMYTYTSYIIFVPLTLVVLFALFKRKIIHSKKEFILSSTLLVLISIPLIFFSSAGNARFSQVGFTQDVTSIGLIDVLNLKLGSCYESLPEILCRVVNNKAVTFSSVFFQNYIHHFSFDFLYIKGTTTQFSLLYERGLLYLYGAVFILVGLFAVFKSRKNIFLIFLLLLSAIPDSLSGSGHDVRSSTMLPFLIIFESVGLFSTFSYLTKKKLFGKTIQLFIVGLVLFSVTSFAVSYFTYFKKHHSSYSLYVYKELSQDLPELSKEYSNIYISTYMNDDSQYIFYLFYNKYDPIKFQSKEDVVYEVEKNGFVNVKKIDNVNFTSFRIVDEIPKEIVDKNSLLIASPNAFPSEVESLKEYKDLSGGVIFKVVEYNKMVEFLDANE